MKGLLSGARHVLVKELRAGNRGIWTPFLVTGFLFFLYLAFLAAVGIAAQSKSPPWTVGANLFLMAGTVTGFLAGFALPLVAVLAIVGEREKRTWDLLRQTPLAPGSIVLGKAGGALAFTLLFLFAALPVFASSFVLGGIAPGRFVAAWGSLGLSLLFLSSLGLSFSADARSQGRAVATLAAFLILVGLVSLGPITSFFMSDFGAFPYSHLFYVHPVFAFTRAGLVDLDLWGNRIPEWVLGDLLLVVATAKCLAEAGGKIVRRENDTAPWKRLALIAFFLVIQVPVYGTPWAGDPQPGLALATLPLAGILFLLVITAPRFDPAEASGKPLFFDPRRILRDRVTSLPSLFVLLSGFTAFLAWTSHSDSALLPPPGEEFFREALFGGILAVLLAALAWHAILIGIQAVTRSLPVARGLTIFFLLLVCLSSMVPGLPHSFWPDPFETENFPREVARGANPVFTLVVVNGASVVVNGASMDPMRASGRDRGWAMGRLRSALCASFAANASIYLLGLGLYFAGGRRARIQG